MAKTNVQLGGGYTYQWECAMLLALNYLYEPARYSPLYDLVVNFLETVESIYLEGEDQASDRYLEDINLLQGPRRILIQVKTKQNEGEQWKPSAPLFLKSLYRFCETHLSSEDPENIRYVFLSNCGFNRALRRIADAARNGALGNCSEATKLHGQLGGFAQKHKGGSIDPDLFRELLGQAAWIEYPKIDTVKANIQAKLEAHQRGDWRDAHALLFEHIARLSTQAGGGTVTAVSIDDLLGLQRRVQVILEGDPSSYPSEKREALKGAIAGILDVSSTAVHILSVSAGSVVIDLEVPARTIRHLRWLLESNDARLRLLRVQKVILDLGKETEEAWAWSAGEFALVDIANKRSARSRHPAIRAWETTSRKPRIWEIISKKPRIIGGESDDGEKRESSLSFRRGDGTVVRRLPDVDRASSRIIHLRSNHMAESFEHGYALLIGVGADLPVTVQDATALRDILVDSQRCAYPVDQLKLLTEDQATRQGILGGLDWLSAQVQGDPKAIAVVYFSGHGGMMPNYHLVPFGYSAQDLANTAISGVEFTEKLCAIQSQKLLILLDCCHAGGQAEVKAPGFVKTPAPPELAEILTAGEGRVMIASSRADEISYTGTPYSIFTQALREGLSGYGASERDGYAYIADIAMYASRVVSSRTRDRQHPTLKLAKADNFAVAYYAGGVKSPHPLPGAQTYIPPIEEVAVDLAAGYRRIFQKYQSSLLIVEDRMAEFFDEAAIPLDLERTKEGILRRIGETEAKIEEQAAKSGWSPPKTAPVGPTLEDVMSRLDGLEFALGSKLNDLKQGQIAIYRRLTPEDQVSLERILEEVRQGRLEQGEIASAVDAVRRTLEHVQVTGVPIDAEAQRALDEIYKAVNSDLSFQQQFELSIPVLPFLSYKIALGAGVDLGAVWHELLCRIRHEN